MADLEAHVEVAGAVIDKEDGKDAKVQNGADELSGLLEQGAEVEGGAEGFRQADEELGGGRGVRGLRNGITQAAEVFSRWNGCARGVAGGRGDRISRVVFAFVHSSPRWSVMSR